MKMHPHHLTSALAFFAGGFLATSTATAALSLSINDQVGNPLAVTVQPGGTFSFALSLLSTAESTVGLSYHLEAIGAGSGLFSLTGRDAGTSSYSDLVTSNVIALQPASALLDPANDDDLGALLANVGTPNGSGLFDVATLTFTTLPGVPAGVYTLRTTADSIATDGGFNDVPLAPVSYTVTVVPEPGSTLLLLAGIGAISARRRR